MAVYAQTTTLDFPRPGRCGNTPMGVLSGTTNLTNYNTTQAEITAITKAFHPSGKLRVVVNGMSSGGFIVKWDATAKAFKAYSTVGATVTPSGGSIAAANPTVSTISGTPATHPLGVVSGGGIVSDAAYSGITGVIAGAITDTRTFTADAGALAEASNDVNVGSFDWIAVGQL